MRIVILGANTADPGWRYLIREEWADNRGVRLHYLDSNQDTTPALLPLVYIHGAWGAAENFLPEMKALAPRRCISVALRGRGKSDAPETGYSFDDNVSDVEAIVDHAGLKNFCLMGWSIEVTYSISYASLHQKSVAGLILLDYPARYPKWPAGWAERLISDPSIAGNPDTLRGLRGLERESSEVLLRDSLSEIKCSVLVIGGRHPDALLKPEHIDNYRQYLPNVQVVVFGDSGHNVSEPDFDRFIQTLESFLECQDNRVSAHPKGGSSRALAF